MLTSENQSLPSRRETPPLEPLAYGIETAAGLAGVGRDTIFRAMRSGKLVAHKIGSRTLITRAALERWLTATPR